MTGNPGPQFEQRRSTTQQESPGPAGVNDSAAVVESGARPRGSQRGPAGHAAEQDALVVSRLRCAWEELEDSRMEIVHIVDVAFLMGDDREEELKKAWSRHEVLARAYFALLTEYFRDHFHPQARLGNYYDISWLLRDEQLAQQIGMETAHDPREMAIELSIQLCERYFEHYQETGDRESLFFFVFLTAETLGQGVDPSEWQSFAMDRIMRKLRAEARRDDWDDPAVKSIRAMLDGWKAGDPLWLIETAKYANKAAGLDRPPGTDPIREDFERHRRTQGR